MWSYFFFFFALPLFDISSANHHHHLVLHQRRRQTNGSRLEPTARNQRDRPPPPHEERERQTRPTAFRITQLRSPFSPVCHGSATLCRLIPVLFTSPFLFTFIFFILRVRHSTSTAARAPHVLAASVSSCAPWLLLQAPPDPRAAPCARALPPVPPLHRGTRGRLQAFSLTRGFIYPGSLGLADDFFARLHRTSAAAEARGTTTCRSTGSTPPPLPRPTRPLPASLEDGMSPRSSRGRLPYPSPCPVGGEGRKDEQPC